MPRQLVEGNTRGILNGSIPDLVAVTVLPAAADPVVFRDSALFSDTGKNPGGFMDGIGQSAVFAGMINNLDSVSHDFEAFIRGTGVPGGVLDLTPILVSQGVDTIGIGATGAIIPLPPLLPGQRVDYEMQEVVTTTAPTFNNSFEDVFFNRLLVDGVRRTQILELFDNTSAFVLDGPVAADDFSLRRFRFFGLSSVFGTIIVNPDTVAHTFTVTVTTASGGTHVVNIEVVAAGAIAGEILPQTLELGVGDSVTVSDATAITTNSPYVIGYHDDII